MILARKKKKRHVYAPKNACAHVTDMLQAISLGIIGPSLIDLEAQTHSTGSQIAFIYTVRGCLAIIACGAMAPVLEMYNR